MDWAMPSNDLDFHAETGRLSLDWMATLGSRDGVPIERITSTVDLERWLAAVAGQRAGRTPSEQELAEAKRLRTALVALMDDLYSGKSPSEQDIATLNEFSSITPPAIRLDVSGRKLQTSAGVGVSIVLGLIARDAIELLTGDDFSKIKRCAGDDCSVYFTDHSRPGKRRWCSMSRCGNKAKKRAFNERKAG
jgi:predicted RNA-binding Zn ribbon-like protein